MILNAHAAGYIRLLILYYIRMYRRRPNEQANRRLHFGRTATRRRPRRAMDEDAIFDAAMSRTTTAKRSRERDRDRDRSRGRDRDRGRDERKRSRTSHSDDDKPVWKPSGPLEDQAAMFQSAPPSSYGHGRGSGGSGGSRGGGGRRGDGPAPEVFSVHHGEVRSIQSYGVFVNMPGFKDGLVHISQLASYRVEDANEVVTQGQRVWVKVVEVDSNGKVSLSMKMVNQETGRDEDPDHFEALEAQGRKGGGGQRGPMKFSEETHLGSVNMGATCALGPARLFHSSYA